ncbi:ParB/RepB/Spo0J family partition protein [Clostridium botulinum]|uniref:ParB protein n=1 Tax=Clostridium botulinum (strain Eklund 17B / Type B) TaxID=935198 RepID=B2TRT0_CLOBB|nr:ParB protein [Clostridium botulinum B str. Eklund 17B (NRP)]MBY6975796.1 ParB/RepB/Spo0J family partition protein [Clostridium botulinum]MBY7000219.1 ParB/RepB/Spo0J family partition protein [Clostridium botulinum]MCR1272977.1 ParB N-terminal domain-containing protein [Clostridium botulinum]NFD71495.1 ParB/RepB/Spo0J family partition protein [Clostridium botulinum]
MANFNMMDLLNNNSKDNKINNIEKSIKFRTSQIDIDDLVPSEENFYSTKEEDLKELKDSIEIFGVQQNLVVKKIKNDKYEIIAGHRRYLALKKLYGEGKEQFRYAPCKVENEEDSIKDKLLLLITNSTARQLTDWEKTQQAEKLKELLVEYKKKEKLPGRVREIVADILNTSATQVARMESIAKNLTEEIKEQFKNGDLGITGAYEASKLSEEEQQEIAKKISCGETVKSKDIKDKNVSVLDTNKSEELVEVNSTTGEIVEQKVPSYLNRKMIDFIKQLNIDEYATFLCDRCIGLGGGNGCAGLCDLALECKGTNKHEVCKRWLNQQI